MLSAMTTFCGYCWPPGRTVPEKGNRAAHEGGLLVVAAALLLVLSDDAAAPPNPPPDDRLPLAGFFDFRIIKSDEASFAVLKVGVAVKSGEVGTWKAAQVVDVKAAAKSSTIKESLMVGIISFLWGFFKLKVSLFSRCFSSQSS